MIDNQKKVDIEQYHKLSEGKMRAVEGKEAKDASTDGEDEIVEKRGAVVGVEVWEEGAPFVDEGLVTEAFERSFDDDEADDRIEYYSDEEWEPAHPYC